MCTNVSKELTASFIREFDKFSDYEAKPSAESSVYRQRHTERYLPVEGHFVLNNLVSLLAYRLGG